VTENETTALQWIHTPFEMGLRLANDSLRFFENQIARERCSNRVWIQLLTRPFPK